MAFNWAGAAGGVQDALSQALKEQLLIQESQQRQQQIDETANWRKAQEEISRQNAESLAGQRQTTIDAANREKAAAERRTQWAQSVMANPGDYDELDLARAKNVLAFGEDLSPSIIAQHIKGPRELTGSSANEQDAMEAMATKLGVRVKDLTPEQRMEAREQGRKRYGQADNQFRPPVPIVVSGQGGFYIVDRTNGVASPLPTKAGGQLQDKPTAGMREQGLSFGAINDQIGTVRGMIAKNPKLTGVLEGTAEQIANKYGFQYVAERAALDSLVQSMRNALIYARSGKQINEAEYERLMREMPDVSQQPDLFMTRLNNIEMAMAPILRRLQAAGAMPAEQAPGGGKVDPDEGKTGKVKDPKTGQIIPVIRRNGAWVRQ